MGAKAKVYCGLLLFIIVFGLRFFCANCQRYPPQQQQQQQIQLQKYQQHNLPLQHQLHAVTIPIQKDLHSNENRLQSQVRLCSNGRLVFPCPTRFRKPIFFVLPIPVRSTSATTTTTTKVPQILRTGASLVVQDATAVDVGQKEYYNTDWSHIDTTNTEQQQEESKPQRRPGKNCKRKRRPQAQISTTESPVLTPLQQYWRGHVSDDHSVEQPAISQQKLQLPEAVPTQMSERTREPSTTKFSERIGEAFSSSSSEIALDPFPTQNLQRYQVYSYSSEYPDDRRPMNNAYSEKIREFNPTKETLIARHPITSTIFDKIQDPMPTRVLERNREAYATKSAEKVYPEAATSKEPERIREPVYKKAAERNRESISTRIREPLAALEKEQKLYEQRDKQRHDFSSEVSDKNHDKSYRRPYSQAKKENTQHAYASREESKEIRSPAPRSPIVLKEILKNSGGLSLSEILQQKNLSLDDLLKGKQNALLALQTTATSPEKPAESSSKERLSKPLRRPSSTTTTTSTTTSTTTEINYSDQSVEKGFEHSGESQEESSGEIASDENKANKNLTSLRKNLKFPRVRINPTTRRQHHFDTTLQQRFSTTTSTTTTKPTTTRLPLYKKRQHTRPSLLRSPNFKKPYPTSSSGSFETSQSYERLDSQEDSSSENLSKRSRTRQSTTTTAQSISDLTDPVSNFVDYSSGENEVLQESGGGFENTSTVNKTDSSILAISDQSDSKAKNQEEPPTDHIYRYNSLKNYIDNNLPHAVLMDIDLADIDPVDDRTDLLELIEDRRSGNRLIKVLEQRNMTLEELIEHRKRGSSQLHLATFVQNRSGVFPGKKVVVNDDMDIVTAFENFPHFNLLNLKSVKPDEIKTDSQGSSYFTSIIDIEPTDESSKEGSGSPPSKASIRNPNSSSNIQRQPFYPSWKSLALASLTTSENAKRFLQHSDREPPQQTAQRHQSTVSEEDPIVQIEDEVARAHDLIDLELSGHGFKRSAMNLMHTSEVPSGIRSAMVASAAIVMTSLVSFMVVFVACRWKQRRRRHKLDYLEAYSAMRSKLPMKSSRRTDELATSTTSLGMDTSTAPSRTSRSNSRQSQSQRHQISISILPGDDCGFLTGPTLSATSSKLNTMDPNSPQVQEYLFNSLRKSF